jgi:hypothetical protein
LYEQGFTISGARNKLDNRASNLAAGIEELPPEHAPAVDTAALRVELLDILALLKQAIRPA